MATGTVAVRFTGDTRDLDQALGRVNTSLGGVSSSFSRIAGVAASAFAGLQVTRFATDVVGAASDVSEALNRVNTIFGANADAIVRWSRTTASTLGQSQSQALQVVGTFGDMFQQLGIEAGSARDMSMALVQLGSDLASFHNANPADVVETLGAAFRGEFDSVQRFVPAITAAAVAEEALRMGLAATASELDANDRALATYSILMRSTTAAQGDFARTSGGVANQQRILAARFEDVKARIGQGLLPVATRLLEVFNNHLLPAFEAVAMFIIDDVIPAVQELGQWLGDHEEVLIGVGVAIAAVLVPAFVSWATAAASAAAATIAATLPIIAIGAAIAALVAGVIWAYQNWGWFRDACDTVARFLTNTLWPAIQAGAGWLNEHLVPAIATVIQWSIEFGRAIWDLVGDIGDALSAIWKTWQLVWGMLGPYVEKVWDFITDVVKDQFEIIRGVIEWLLNAMQAAINLATALGDVIGSIPGVEFLLGIPTGGAASGAAEPPKPPVEATPSTGGKSVTFNVDGSTTEKAFARMEMIASHVLDRRSWDVN